MLGCWYHSVTPLVSGRYIWLVWLDAATVCIPSAVSLPAICMRLCGVYYKAFHYTQGSSITSTHWCDTIISFFSWMVNLWCAICKFINNVHYRLVKLFKQPLGENTVPVCTHVYFCVYPTFWTNIVWWQHQPKFHFQWLRCFILLVLSLVLFVNKLYLITL